LGWTAAFAYGKKYKQESGPQTEIYVPRWPTNEPTAVESFEFNAWTNASGTEEVKGRKTTFGEIPYRVLVKELSGGKRSK
jgi:hypothetical protein